eukprot:XP_014024597.1 PREDICTED: protein transport protein Sec16B-like [Salmo salar]
MAELLMRNSQGQGGSGGSEGSEAPTLIDLSKGPSPETIPLDGADLLTGAATSVCLAEFTEDMQGYAKLLLAGRKKEALELAMKSGLWGHALFLASKMDNRFYITVLNSLSFKEFAQNSAIRCTELFEYCQRLGDKFFTIPSFQVYKFLYVGRFLDIGLASQAYHYCEVIWMSLLRLQELCMVLLGELIKA